MHGREAMSAAGDSPASRLRQWARRLKRDVTALYLAAGDPRVPWYAKAVAMVVAAYALSPIDLIPDFVPVLGYLDDLLIVPLGILLAVKLVPPALMAEFRETASRTGSRPSIGRWGALLIATLWLVAIIVLVRWLIEHYADRLPYVELRRVE
jgi:uncharacterized membrane protein YkvA (DUF1232 family)